MSHKRGSVAILLGLIITAALYGQKKADFSRFVVAGDSLSAGYQNSQLIESGQVHGYANVIAAQAHVSLNLPLVLSSGGYPWGPPHPRGALAPDDSVEQAGHGSADQGADDGDGSIAPVVGRFCGIGRMAWTIQGPRSRAGLLAYPVAPPERETDGPHQHARSSGVLDCLKASAQKEF